MAPRKERDKPRPTLPNPQRHAMAALMLSKLPGAVIDWKSGHGRFLANGRLFCNITREGDLALLLSPERMEELIGLGEAKPMAFGERVLNDRIVIDPRLDPKWALSLLREAKQYAESQGRTSKKKA